MTTTGPFIPDIAEIRRRSRAHIENGATTQNAAPEVETTIRLLNDAVANELVCVLRYKFHSFMADGIHSESVKAEFAAHAAEEMAHLDLLADRICQLGGKPNLSPEGLLARAATQYVEGTDLVDMIKENLVAERIGIELYRDLIRFFADKDPTTRTLLEKILAKEEEHAHDMQDLLVTHRHARSG